MQFSRKVLVDPAKTDFCKSSSSLKMISEIESLLTVRDMVPLKISLQYELFLSIAEMQHHYRIRIQTLLKNTQPNSKTDNSNPICIHNINLNQC